VPSPAQRDRFVLPGALSNPRAVLDLPSLSGWARPPCGQMHVGPGSDLHDRAESCMVDRAPTAAGTAGMPLSQGPVALRGEEEGSPPRGPGADIPRRRRVGRGSEAGGAAECALRSSATASADARSPPHAPAEGIPPPPPLRSTTFSGGWWAKRKIARQGEGGEDGAISSTSRSHPGFLKFSVAESKGGFLSWKIKPDSPDRPRGGDPSSCPRKRNGPQSERRCR